MSATVSGQHDSFFIGGEWVPPSSSERIDVISPHTGQVIASVPGATPPDVDRAVLAARRAFDDGEWPRMSASERIDRLERLADAYSRRLDEMATVISAEMGAPITMAKERQAPAGLRALRATLAVGREHDWNRDDMNSRQLPVVVRREPLGVVGAIVPWNMPQATTMSKVSPALVAGCTVVLKPAPETPLDANLLAELVAEAEIPPGVLNVIPAGRETGAYLVSHPLVDKVSFTGSTEAGRRIASICGQQLKRCTLELGGKSAAIVLDDADLESTIRGLRSASFPNSGQACVAQTRVLVSEARYDEVVDALASLASSFRLGDPSDPETEMGPLVSHRQRERVEGYIAIGRSEGASVVAGGARPAHLDHGWYVEPTVFRNVDNSMRIAQEEIFGPVVVVIPYRDVDDAIRIANESAYGLAGSVWTADGEMGMHVARRVKSGIFGVNGHLVDFGVPFGGYKCSGIGREGGHEGIDHYCEIKTVTRF